MCKYEIRPATVADFVSIYLWLESEHDQILESGGSESAFHNIELIDKGRSSRDLIALIDASSDSPVGFYLKNECTEMRTYGIDLFEIKPAHRRLGLGRFLANHAIDEAKKNLAFGIDGECISSLAFRFWKSLGFSKVPPPGVNRLLSRESSWIAMQLSRELKLPYGRPCKVKIEIGQPENFKKVFESGAILEESYFSLFLAKSFSYYVPSIEKISHVRITCDEKISFEEKIKYMSDSINGYWVPPWIGFEEIIIPEDKLSEFSI